MHESLSQKRAAESIGRRYRRYLRMGRQLGRNSREPIGIRFVAALSPYLHSYSCRVVLNLRNAYSPACVQLLSQNLWLRERVLKEIP